MNWMREPDAEAIPGYKLVCPLGTGGFGEVWKCVAPGGIHKAIKFVYGNMNSLDGDAAKAKQECKALERVKLVRHPFVLSVDRIDEVDGELLLVMELADKSLHDCFNEYVDAGRAGIPRDVLVGFLADAAEGLNHLIEKHNLQHLDVKPKNLFLIAERVKVADFGLVKHLERQSSSGLMGGVTPVYAAPETFANKISKHSDQYSLAVVYVELLTGKRPFAGKNIRQLALQHMTEAPDLSELPEADRPVVARALAKNPDERYPNCAAFVRCLSGGQARADMSNGGSFSDIAVPGRIRAVSSAEMKLPRQSSADIIVSTTVSRLEVGVLRPAILIGVGSFGRRAVQQIRCRLLDRVGDLTQVPSFRFLYLDPDPKAADKATNAPAEIALNPEDVLALPLQPVTAYRRKQIDQILDWLPREKLYSIPRSLAAEGSRALGRLAFCDHYMRIMSRLRHEIQLATHPEAIKQSCDQTGLVARGKVPSVYVFASAMGGSGGMILDLGYAIRKALEKFNMTDAPITSFVFAGAPEDPASPQAELANICATLTELNHYADPDVTFTAQYGGAEGPKTEANGLPFTATYVMPMAQRTSEGFRDCVSHLSGYVAHELTTPLGVGLEDIRKNRLQPGRTPFRGFGTFGVWYPRGLLLRSAAKQLTAQIFREWAEVPAGGMPVEVTAVTESILGDNRLTPESVQSFIAAEAGRGTDGQPVEYIVRWVRALSEQADAAVRRGEVANWAIDAWDQAKDLTGLEPTTDEASAYRRGRLSKALDPGIRTATAAWENEFAALIRPLDELIGPRLAATESCLRTVVTALAAASQSADDQLAKLGNDRAEAREAVQAALSACQGELSGFGLFGSRTARALRTFTDKVAKFTELRVKEDLIAATGQFYRRMWAKLDDRIRALAHARDRLSQLVELMQAPILLANNAATTHEQTDATPDLTDEAMQTTLQMTNTVRVVLPNGASNLDRAAQQMLSGVTRNQITNMQHVLHNLVVEPRGGLPVICTTMQDLPRALAIPVIEQATAFLSNLLPAHDVAEIEMTGRDAGGGGLQRRIASYIKLAAPQAGGPPGEERIYVLVPSTDAGAKFAKEVKLANPKAVAVTVTGQGTDLLFCREAGTLRTSDLQKLIDPCWDAYQLVAENPDTSPHCRFDVSEWMPLAAR